MDKTSYNIITTKEPYTIDPGTFEPVVLEVPNEKPYVLDDPNRLDPGVVAPNNFEPGVIEEGDIIAPVTPTEKQGISWLLIAGIAAAAGLYLFKK